MARAKIKEMRHWTAARFAAHQNAAALATIIVLCAIWGSTFPMTKGVLASMPALNYLALRFTIASVAGLVLFFSRVRALTAREWFYGIVLGLIYTAGQLFQTLGLLYIDASISGFITVMYVVFTPMLVWLLFRVKVGLMDWISVALAMAGLALLSLSGGSINFGLGEGYSLLGALMFALHIVMMGRWASRGDVVAMAVVQMMVMSVSFTLASAREGLILPQNTADWLAIIFMATVAGLAAMALQSWTQTILSATTVALTFSLEPVFASVFAILFWGELMTSRLIWGGLLIMLAMQVSVLGPRFLERRYAVAENETVLPQTSAGLSQAFEDVVTGGLPHSIVEGEDILGSEGLHRTFENGPTESITSSHSHLPKKG